MEFFETKNGEGFFEMKGKDEILNVTLTHEDLFVLRQEIDKILDEMEG